MRRAHRCSTKALSSPVFVGEGQLVDELLRLHADLAGQLEGDVALAGVAAQHHELAAVEQVGQLRRIDFAQTGRLSPTVSFRLASTGWLILLYRPLTFASMSSCGRT